MVLDGLHAVGVQGQYFAALYLVELFEGAHDHVGLARSFARRHVGQ